MSVQFKENTGNTKSAKRIKEKALQARFVYMRRNNRPTSFRPRPTGQKKGKMYTIEIIQ